MLSKRNILLICEGLDTVADVYINAVLIGQSTNMFQRYVWDIKKTLVPGSNNITIKFTSAVTYSAFKSTLYNYTIPPNCPPSVQHGECHVNLIRKKQCSFSWVSQPIMKPFKYIGKANNGCGGNEVTATYACIKIDVQKFRITISFTVKIEIPYSKPVFFNNYLWNEKTTPHRTKKDERIPHSKIPPFPLIWEKIL